MTAVETFEAVEFIEIPFGSVSFSAESRLLRFLWGDNLSPSFRDHPEDNLSPQSIHLPLNFAIRHLFEQWDPGHQVINKKSLISQFVFSISL